MTIRGFAWSRTLVAALLGILLAGCVATPASNPHEQPLSRDELALAGPDYAPPATGWWQALHDPQLDRLVAQALARNPGIAGALARVRLAQAQATLAGAPGEPQVDFEAHEYRQKVSANYIFPPPYAGSTFWDGRIGFNLNWQLDFWGRQTALVEQAVQGAHAVALDATGSELLLSSSVAQAYVDYTRSVLLGDVARRGEEQRQRVVELTAQRVSAGLDSVVETRLAEANLAQSALEIERVQLAQQQALHALAALTGSTAAQPLALSHPGLKLEEALPVPRELPANLLAHRPDVAAARTRVVAAEQGRVAAHAAFYPNINLVAFAGTTAIGLDRLFQSDSLTLNAGPAIQLPIFDGGRLRAEYAGAGAQIDAAVASYNETVLRAVREAADQISRLDSLERQLADQARALAAAESAYGFAETRYGAGLTTQITLLNTETQVLAARRERVGLLADRSAARIALLVALGGTLSEEPIR